MLAEGVGKGLVPMSIGYWYHRAALAATVQRLGEHSVVVQSRIAIL